MQCHLVAECQTSSKDSLLTNQQQFWSSQHHRCWRWQQDGSDTWDVVCHMLTETNWKVHTCDKMRCWDTFLIKKVSLTMRMWQQQPKLLIVCEWMNINAQIRGSPLPDFEDQTNMFKAQSSSCLWTESSQRVWLPNFWTSQPCIQNCVCSQCIHGSTNANVDIVAMTIACVSICWAKDMTSRIDWGMTCGCLSQVISLN